MLWRLVVGTIGVWLPFWIWYTVAPTRDDWYHLPLFLTLMIIASLSGGLIVQVGLAYMDDDTPLKYKQQDWRIMRWLLRQ